MRIETIKRKSKSACVNLTGGTVDSLRVKNKSSVTVRVYDGGKIGVAGKKGSASIEDLKAEAIRNLSRGISYPDIPNKPFNKSINVKKDIIKAEDFMGYVDDTAKKISEQNPAFIISGKAYLSELETSYESTDGRKLDYAASSISFGISFKAKDSANIMDGGIDVEDDALIGDDFVADVKTKLDAFLTPVGHVAADKVPVIMSASYFSYALSHFVADAYCSNASLLNGKLKSKVFGDKLSVCLNRDPSERLLFPFFDVEGVVNNDYRSYLVKNGVMEKLLSTKLTADKYGIENAGCAEAEYVGAPGASAVGLDVDVTADKIEDLVGDGEAIYLDMSFGGDMTPDGNMSLPAQLAFLYKGGKLVGKLPEFVLCGNIFDVFGDDFLGACSLGSVFKSMKREKVVVAHMNVVNKK